MEPRKDNKRKKDRSDDDERRVNKLKKARSRSRSPEKSRSKDSRQNRRRSRSQPRDNPLKQEKQISGSKEVKAEPPVRKNKETDMLNTRTGGAYIPPARLRMLQAQITDKSSIAYQRLAWEALKKSIHGHINKINVGNIGIIIKELLKENIVRGRGLLCRSVIQAQAASPTFTNVYAALVAAVNSRFPNIGELLLKRLVIQFKRGFKRNDKSICISAASFIAHLVNQRVAHEILALELLTLLVETPSDDSVEVAIAFLKECGQKLTEVSSKGVNAIFEMLRNILHEGQLDKRVQYMIEVMFQVWKDGFKDHPALLEELELVPEEEQFTHLLMLDDATDPQDILNVFKHDEKYEENEQKYKTLSKEILGSDAESGEGSGESGSEESDDEEDEGETEQKEMTIIDNTETNLVALRRTIYLTINSSLDFEECAHKLLKMSLKPGQEIELCHMFLDCCAEQRTYEKFYGLLAQRFCNLNRIYIGPFEEIFKESYGTAHRLDTNRLRNVSKFFAHLLFTDSISWEVLECVKLNEEDTTSSSRIYIKILFQELAEYMGLKKLNDRLKDPTLQGAFQGVFPRDNPKNTRFSINFFTTIGLGGLTDELREHLKQMPKNVPPPPEINLEGESSSSSSSSSSSDSSDSSSESEEDSAKKKKKDKKKSKDKSPKTPEEPEQSKNTERWGHDGFYDTYGKDARRHEQTHERDKDNFVIPQTPRRNDRRNQNDDKRNQKDDRRNQNDDRRNLKEDKRRDRERRNDDERSRRDRDENNGKNRERDDSRGSRDSRRNGDAESKEGGERRNKDSDRRDKERISKDDESRDSRRNRDDERERNSKNDNQDKDKIRDREERRDDRISRKESKSEKRDKHTRDDRLDESRDKDRNDKENDRKDRENRDEIRDKKDRKREKRERNGKDDRREIDDRSERRKRNDRHGKEREGTPEIRSGVDKDGIRWEINGEYKKRDVKKESDSDSSDSESSSSSSEYDKTDDGWDIRGSSVRRETVGRYWDLPDKRRETVERSPVRETRRNR